VARRRSRCSRSASGSGASVTLRRSCNFFAAFSACRAFLVQLLHPEGRIEKSLY
jgi:hypothetical protein